MKNSAWAAWAVKNSIVVICFAALAVYFNHWWIVLFACLLTSSLETKSGGTDSVRFTCEDCGKVESAKKEDLEGELRWNGWVSRKVGGKWLDHCPECQRKRRGQ